MSTDIHQLRIAKYKCESDFLFFTRYFFLSRTGQKFILNSHHFEIAKALQRVINGLTTRLIINVPPRYGKTELCVINFIAWCIARDASAKFIHLSYSDDLVLDNSSQVKELLQSDEYQRFWPVPLKSDSQSKKKWYTASGGGVYATSAGGAVTGFGAGSVSGGFGGAIIIDDPLKPDDSEYDLKRTRVNKRVNTTIKSRLNSRDTPIIVIMQRVHDDDMTGFLLDGGSGEKWELLKIPAINDGTPLWDQKHTLADLRQLEKADRYTFSGQYMQEPIPDDGVFFQKSSFRWYETLPACLNFYGSSDYAVTDGGGDYTEHGIFGVCPDGNVFISEWWSGQAKADVWIESQIDLIEKYRTLKWAGETGPIKQAVEPWLTKRMRERKKYTVLEWLSHSRGSKEANARSFQALLEAGRVYLPVDAPWVNDLVSQLVRFPMAKYDDKVDVCSLFGRMIADVWASTPPEGENKRDKLDDYWHENEAEDGEWMLV